MESLKIINNVHKIPTHILDFLPLAISLILILNLWQPGNTPGCLKLDWKWTCLIYCSGTVIKLFLTWVIHNAGECTAFVLSWYHSIQSLHYQYTVNKAKIQHYEPYQHSLMEPSREQKNFSRNNTVLWLVCRPALCQARLVNSLNAAVNNVRSLL